MQVPDPLVGLGWIVGVLGTAGLVVYWVALRVNHRRHYGPGSYGETDPGSKTNCPACGARVDAKNDECEYCGEPLADERSSGDARSAEESDGRARSARDGSD